MGVIVSWDQIREEIAPTAFSHNFGNFGSGIPALPTQEGVDAVSRCP